MNYHNPYYYFLYGAGCTYSDTTLPNKRMVQYVFI